MAEGSVYDLEHFSNDLDYLLAQEKESIVFRDNAQDLLRKLLSNQEFIADVLDKMVSDDTVLKGKIGTIDRNDIMVHLSSKGNFSMRLFVWAPLAFSPIHDHGAWGVIGALAGQVEETKYRRLDDGSKEGYAKIEQVSTALLNPGDTSHVSVFDDGIHKTGNSGDTVSLSLHVYGRAVRKGFIQCFNMEENSVHNLVTPKLEKRLFAVKALGALSPTLAKTSIEKAFHDPHPLVRWESIKAMEQIDKAGWITLLKEAASDSDEGVRKKANVLLNKT
ncbi:MAG: HEAT repeat domain-containing protein [Chloroflexota bacterium]|nr:HEAT repeat domain-containing protein [Chloroflexota bacterium]